MTTNRPKPSDWKRNKSVLNAGIRGFNPLTELPVLLTEQFGWLKDFTFGFFSEGDIPERRSMGWTFLKREHFEIDSFNEAIGLAFGLTDDSAGNIKWRENFIMIMPKDYRSEIIDARHSAFENRFKTETENTKYIVPGSEPKHAEAAEADYKQFQVINQPTQVKRGRPPKTQE